MLGLHFVINPAKFTKVKNKTSVLFVIFKQDNEC